MNNRYNIRDALKLAIVFMLSVFQPALAQQHTTAPGYELPDLSQDSSITSLHNIFDTKITSGISVVGLGEVSHGAQEAMQFKKRMIQYLVTEKGFRKLLVEFTNVDLKVLNAFLGDNEQKDVSQIRRLVDHAFYSSSMTIQTTVDLMTWLKKFNLTHPGDPVQVIGIDIIGMWPSFSNYLFYNFLLPFDYTSAEQLQYKWSSGVPDSLRWLDLKQWFTQRSGILQERLSKAQFEQLQADMKDADNCAVYNTLNQTNYYKGGFFRDSIMADNVRQRSTGKSIIWSHNVHLDKEPTAMTFGNMTHARIGAAYYTILTDFSGDANVSVFNKDPKGPFMITKEFVSQKQTAARQLLKKYHAANGIFFHDDLQKDKITVKMNNIDAYGNNSLIGYGQAFDAIVIFNRLTPVLPYDQP
ncbi:erythromycin esterase family protein [Chitinophaga arvensicola]|uniref:Erythromycin esterase homolog n=1 Tax=Chitinophaga arvensicola TaxID=29529 RepID=A0A1I0SAL2_9BACT|nr:erythromycin esterase family protein [Chitinophaga arvensicola]SEW53471.1 Erythromycin esterase homolog [Chitinophaga arvensicola]